MKKGQTALEFLMTYGWAILIVLAAIGFLAYFGVFGKISGLHTENVTEVPIYEKVCQNLDNGTAVFPQIITTKIDAENSLGLRIVSLFGNETYPKLWDNEGVMCAMPIEACHPQYLFCFKLEMIIPVNYTIYNDWANRTDGVI